MEDKSTSTLSLPAAEGNGNKPPLMGEIKEKKKAKRGFTFFKVAMYMIRRRPNDKAKAAVVANDTLKKFVGSIRPLYLQDTQSPAPPSFHHNTSSPAAELPHSEPTMSSPRRLSSNLSSFGSTDSLSQYGSAMNLQELEKRSENRAASSSNLQELDKGSGGRPASSSDLQDLDKGSDSRYASAENLLELESENKDGKSEKQWDEDEGDEKIDSKAEEFIAMFYKQMRLQNMQSAER